MGLLSRLFVVMAFALAGGLAAQPINTLGTGSSNPAAAGIAQGATGRTCVQFTLVRSNGNGQFSQLVVGNSGTAGASGFTEARLYQDLNNNGQFDGGETLLSTAASGTYPRTFTIATPVVVSTTAISFIVVVDVSSSAPVGNTFALTIATSGVTFNNGTMAGSTVTGGTQTVQAAPEMDVQRPASFSITDDTTDPVGSHVAGTAFNLVYTIQNTGAANLDLTGTPDLVVLNTFNNCSATVSVTPTTPVGTGATTTFTVSVTPQNPGAAFSFTLSINNNDANENPYNFVVSGSTPIIGSHLAITTQPGNGSGGSALSTQPVLEVRDGATGPVDTSFNGSVTAAITTGTGTSGAAIVAGFTANIVSGIATFSGLAIDLAGSGYSLTFSTTSLASAVSSTFDVNVGVAVTLVVATQPGNGTGGSALSTQPVIQVRDAGGNVVPSSATVAAAITTGTGTTGASIVSGGTAVSAAGIATFAGLAIDLAGNGYTLTFSATGLTSAVSSPLDITVGAAASLLVTTQPGNGTGGLALSTQPVVTVRDAGGNTVTGSSASVTASITTGTGSSGATIVAGLTANASAGIATFAGLAVDLAGTGYTLTMSATGLAPDVSAAFDVTVGPEAGLRVLTQPSGAVIGTSFVTQPEVEIVDAGGNVVTTSTASVAVVITSGTGATGATLSGTSPVSAIAGLAVFTNLALDLPGTGYTLTFTATGLNPTDSATFGVASNATKLGLGTQPGGAFINQAFVTQPVIEVQDAAGSLVATDNTTQVTATISAGTGAFTGTSTVTVTAVNGLVTFTDLAIDTAGLGFTLDFADTSSILSGITSAAFNVVGAATQLAITTQPGGASQATAFLQQAVVEIRDANGLLVFVDSTTQVTATITAASGTTGAVLGGGGPITAVNGVVTFTGLTINLAGTGYTLDFSDSGALTDATSGAFDVTSTTTGGGGGGGGGGEDDGCSTGTRGTPWLAMVALLSSLVLIVRKSRRSY